MHLNVLSSCIYDSQDTETTEMSPERWTDKDVVYMYNKYCTAMKKEWSNAIYSKMDRLRDYHMKWSKSDRERNIPHDITNMWNLKEWHKLTYLQNRRDSETQKTNYGYPKGKRGGERHKLGID